MFPDAVTSYELPNAILGYEPGYGEVADDWPKGTTTDAQHLRIILIVAVKNDLAWWPVRWGGRSTSSGPTTGRGAAVTGEPRHRQGHGQVRQQLHVARRPASIVVVALGFQSCTALATAMQVVSQSGSGRPSCTAHIALSTIRTITQARARSSSNPAASTRV